MSTFTVLPCTTIHVTAQAMTDLSVLGVMR